MADSNIRLFQATVRSFRDTIVNTPEARQQLVSIDLANYYNSLVDKAAEFTELSDHLPPKIEVNSGFSAMGRTAQQHVVLLVYLNQLMAITDRIDED